MQVLLGQAVASQPRLEVPPNLVRIHDLDIVRHMPVLRIEPVSQVYMRPLHEPRHLFTTSVRTRDVDVVTIGKFDSHTAGQRVCVN
jgi:hypothetical protein